MAERWTGKRVLFQGDSITDAGRDRELSEPNHPRALGGGYAFHTAANLLRTNIPFELEVFNRGISGNKVFQLQERWQEDCLDLEPDLLSILIGVNDFWHSKSHEYEGTVETYENDYRRLLERTLEARPSIAIMIGEPFLVEGGTALQEGWEEEFSAYREAALKLAREFNTGFVPYQSYFDKALVDAPVSYWCPDGVHPSIPGAVVMAEAWLETFKFM